MINKLQLFWCWLAGFWEADGSIFVYKDKKSNKIYNALRVDLSQQDEKLLKWIKRVLSRQGISGCLQKYPSKDGCYQIRISTRQAEKFIRSIYPYVNSDKKRNRIKKSFKEVNKSTNLVGKYYYD